MPTRKSWAQLSPEYRARLARQGITAANHGQADLRKARGHAFKGPKSQAPEQAREAFVEGKPTPKDRQSIAKWRKSRNYPSWLPKDPAELDDQTAVILSTIYPPPNRKDRAGRRAGWRSVDVKWPSDPNDDEPITVVIQPVRGRSFEIELPDRDAVRQLLQILRQLNTPGLQILMNGDHYPKPKKKSKPRKSTKAKKTSKKKQSRVKR